MNPLNTAIDPRAVGPFELLRVLGQGGMGRAYLARRLPLERLGPEYEAAYHLAEPDDDSAGPGLAVVKVIRPSVFTEYTAADQQKARDRFEQEVDAIRSVLSARVPALRGADVATDRPWLAMDYVHGPTLHRLVTGNGPLDVVPFAGLGLALVEALRAIHGEKILHRDLKPSNIVLGPAGPVVLDFGLAVLSERRSSGALTETGASMGTHGYTPMEQLLDAKHVEEPADVYAFGATLYFAVTKAPPYPVAPTGSPPDWDGIDDGIRELLAPMLLHEAGQRPVLDVVEDRLTALLDAHGSSPEEADEALATLVRDSGLIPVLPPEALTDQPDPEVREQAQRAVDDGAAPDSPWAAAGAELFDELFAASASDGDDELPASDGDEDADDAEGEKNLVPGGDGVHPGPNGHMVTPADVQPPGQDGPAPNGVTPVPAQPVVSPKPAPPARDGAAPSAPTVATSYRLQPPAPRASQKRETAFNASPATVPPAAAKAADRLRRDYAHSRHL
ncbi:serine/threonine protein kinase [Streptomyces sp. NPDC058305]|uniref:serine/threonine protein kinase n=1 Tax=Streptomyces sp. NPDC058305 TaxID=3346438 RepID=UPI0036E04E15